ncbi:MAG: hypothetical protein WBX25_10710 [Rhodomicrobium sp.]
MSIQTLENQARSAADQVVDRMRKSGADEEDIAEAWEDCFQEASSEAEQKHEHFVEMSARWKARQALRWLD